MQKIILLEDGIKNYIRHCARERKLSENTLKSYRIVLNKFRRFIRKNMQIDQIQEVTKEVIRVYLEHLNESWKSSTARHHINVVQGFFAYLEEDVYKRQVWKISTRSLQERW